MKYRWTIAKVIAVILATAMTAGLCSCSNILPTETQRETSAETEETTETEEITETIEETMVESPADAVPEQERFVRQSGKYVTYPYQSATFLESVPNDCAYGTDVKCTAMQCSWTSMAI